MKNQSCKDFQWLVIDDGSSDNTKTVVESFIKNSDFCVEYHYKQNGGKHTALNYAHSWDARNWGNFLPDPISLSRILDN